MLDDAKLTQTRTQLRLFEFELVLLVILFGGVWLKCKATKANVLGSRDFKDS